MKRPVVLVLWIAVYAVLACSSERPAPRNGRDIAVSASPDKKFEATVRLLDIDGSIGVSQPYQVLIRSLAVDQETQSVVLTADKTDGLRVRWIGAGQLEVCYAQARIYDFQNTFVVARREPPTLAEAETLLVKRNSLLECGAIGPK